MDNDSKKKEVMKKLLKGKGGPGAVDSDSAGQYKIDDPTKASANMDSGMPNGQGGPGDMIKKAAQKVGTAARIAAPIATGAALGAKAVGSAVGKMQKVGNMVKKSVEPSRFSAMMKKPMMSKAPMDVMKKALLKSTVKKVEAAK